MLYYNTKQRIIIEKEWNYFDFIFRAPGLSANDAMQKLAGLSAMSGADKGI